MGSSSRSSYSKSRSRSRDNDRRRKGRRYRKRKGSDDSDEQVREQRKKQERLAKLRAMAYDSEFDAKRDKEVVQTIEKAAKTGQPQFKGLGLDGHSVGSASGINRQVGDSQPEDEQTAMDVERYGTHDEQINNADVDHTKALTQIEKQKKIGLMDELEDGENEPQAPILTEEEIEQTKMLLNRDWRKNKNKGTLRAESYQDDDDDSDDGIAGVFKMSFAKPANRPKPPSNDSKKLGSIAFALPTRDEREEQEIKEEQEKLKAAEARGEDVFEAYMKDIEPKAVKQETFNMAERLQKQRNKLMNIDNEDNEVGENLIATINDIPVGQDTKSNGDYAEKMNEEPTDEPDDLEGQKFIEALKNMDRLQETEEEKRALEEVEEKPDIYAADDQGVFDSDEDVSEEEHVDYFAKREKLAEKRTLKPVNHADVEYEPYRKNLYIECEDITSKTEADIEYFRRELGDIKIRGVDCPRPIENWYQCGLSDKILRVLIDKNKFMRPFAIQCQAIPMIMSGRDCIGIAETGSGKTLAFVLPMLRHIMDQRPLSEGEGPIALIMVPTRELALQVYNDTKIFCKPIGLNAVCIYGGGGVAGQLSELKRGCEIVICTPGRMIEVLTTSNGKITNLKRATYIVLDEADRMFDLGFEPQISRILSNVRPDRQTVMFSATFPRNVETLAKKILTRPDEIVVGNRGQVGRNILQMIEVIESEKKKVKLLEILGYWSSKGQILIFVDKQTEADNLFVELVSYGYSPLVLHGGQDMVDRQFTINDFKRGTKNILIATSLCARGLDIKKLVLVINYSCPTFKEDYTHRIGRTGRAGNKGTAITFITPDEDLYAGDIIQALQLANVDPPEDLMRLHERFMVKVRRGEAKEIKNRNLTGSGYRFSAEEMVKMKEFKNTLKDQFGIDLGDDNMSMTSRAMTMKTTTMTDVGTRAPKSSKDGSKVVKDQKTKDAIRKAATRAATQAIIAGATPEEVQLAALNSIKEILQRLKEGEVIGKNTGLDELYRARDEMLEKGEGKSGQHSQNFDINDYPESTRQKVCDREYLDMVSNLTQTTITVRGTVIEPGRRALIGQKKLHIHVESDDQFNLHSAIDEIKKYCEDSAITSLTANGGYTGYTSKY